MAAAPVVTVPQPAEIVPVPAPYPVTVVPAPPVILQTPSYCAPPPYVHLSPCPRPVPYRGAYPGYHSGYGHYKAQTGLRNSPGMTPPRTPAMQLPPMVSRSRITWPVHGVPCRIQTGPTGFVARSALCLPNRSNFAEATCPSTGGGTDLDKHDFKRLQFARELAWQPGGLPKRANSGVLLGTPEMNVAGGPCGGVAGVELNGQGLRSVRDVDE